VASVVFLDASVDTAEKRHLLIPVFNVICPCLPSFIRRRLHCGVEHESVEDSDDQLTCCCTCDDFTCTQVSQSGTVAGLV